MKPSFVGLAIAALSVALVAPAFATDDATTVKVALTDVSSAMGGWRGSGPGPGMTGMMGPGMMGYGWSNPGQGGNGPMGPGMMAPGMMGHGMMAVRIDHDTVKAGQVRFDVTNWSRGMIHQLLVIRVDGPQAPLPYDYTQGKVAEDQVKPLGDTGNLEPNTSSTLDIALTPGTYLLICNVPGHYAAGMATPLTVTQ
jgi:uncharacterized cupredoxin-like copper-binding protein